MRAAAYQSASCANEPDMSVRLASLVPLLTLNARGSPNEDERIRGDGGHSVRHVVKLDRLGCRRYLRDHRTCETQCVTSLHARAPNGYHPACFHAAKIGGRQGKGYVTWITLVNSALTDIGVKPQ